jgi:hypothetical protein
MDKDRRSAHGTFQCDICQAEQVGDASVAAWYTAAAELGGKGLRLFRWPTGSRLREAHDKLFHVCSMGCLQTLVTRWSGRELE